jgi:hypothetical protein
MQTYDPFQFFNRHFKNPSSLDLQQRRGQVELFTWFEKVLSLLSKPKFSFLQVSEPDREKASERRVLGATLAGLVDRVSTIVQGGKKSISAADSTIVDDTMKNQNLTVTKSKLKTVVNGYRYDDDDPQELFTIKALNIISKLEATEFLPDLISLLLRGGNDSSIYEQVFETILALDPDLKDEKVRSGIVKFLEEDIYPHAVIKLIAENQETNSFAWLKERIEQRYSDPTLDLQLNDLKLLATLSILKPKIADYSEPLAEVFMMNQGDVAFQHAVIDVLNSYFPETGINFKPLIDDHVARLALSDNQSDQSLIRKMKHYTGEKSFPSWDTKGQLKSEFLDLQRQDSKPVLYKFGESTLTYDENGRPRSLKNQTRGLSVQYHYNDDESLKAILVKHKDQAYPFVLDGDEIHAFSDLPSAPILCGKTSYPAMKLLDDEANQSGPFICHEPDEFVLYKDGCVQIDDDQKTIIVSPSGSVHVTDNALRGVREFITVGGDYYHLEPKSY